MGFMAYKGTFTRRSGTGLQSVTSAGMTEVPKLVLFWGTRGTVESRYTAGNTEFHFGAAAGAGGEGGWYYTAGEDGTTTGIASTGAHDTDCINMAYFPPGPAPPTDDGVASWSQWLTSPNNGFEIDWSVNGTASAIEHYLAFGGGDITNVKVGTFTTASSIGTQNVDVGFAPDIVWILTSTNASSFPFDDNKAVMSLGCGVSSTERWAQGWLGKVQPGGNNKAVSGQRADRIIWVPKSVTTPHQQADYNGPITSPVNGFQLNWSTIRGGKAAMYIAMKGTFDVTIGNFIANLSAGTQDITGMGFDPSAVFMSGWHYGSDTTFNPDVVFSYGAAHDDTTPVEGACGPAVDDGPNTIWARDFTATDCVHYVKTPGTGGGSESEADLNDFITDGMQLDWTIRSGLTRPQVVYAAFGGAGTVSAGEPGHLASLVRRRSMDYQLRT